MLFNNYTYLIINNQYNTMEKIPYVHSSYERKKDDFYKTIDERCTIGFLQQFKPNGLCIDICSPSGSGIVDVLLKYGYKALCVGDAFERDIKCQWIVTNPPYKRPLVDQIIERQLKRLADNEVQNMALLLRSNFDFAKTRAWMFGNKLYSGQIKLLFRPWWSEQRKSSPIHNYCWHIWSSKKLGVPFVKYSNGESL